jgi:hypothetical protein
MVGQEVCYRMEVEAQYGNRVVCEPLRADGGCSSDYTRAVAAELPKVYPPCECTEAHDGSPPPSVRTKACVKVLGGNEPSRRLAEGRRICYPEIANFDATKGDDYKYYGCPVDMVACMIVPQQSS